MKSLSKGVTDSFEKALDVITGSDIQHMFESLSREDIIAAFIGVLYVKDLCKQNSPLNLPILLTALGTLTAKKNFLVFKNNKYVNVPTENVAFFHIQHGSIAITCFDRQEYFINYTLEQIQSFLPSKQFFRLNRQFLINFSAVKEVEHYFARKLIVKTVVSTHDQLLVSKEKVGEFMHWLEDR